MTNQRIAMIWGFLYGICAALGFFPNPTGAFAGLMILLSVVFFIPPEKDPIYQPDLAGADHLAGVSEFFVR